MNLRAFYEKHNAQIRCYSAAQYQQLATDLGVTDDVAIKLIRMAHAEIEEAKQDPSANRQDAEEYLIAPWPKLISLDSPTLPALNLSALPTWLGEQAKAISASTETPPELAGGMVLAAAATAAARRLTISPFDGYVEPTNLWLNVTLDPANLKSTVVNTATAPLTNWQHEQAEQVELEIKAAVSERKTTEARIKALRAAAANVKTKPSDIQRYTDEILELENGLPDTPIAPRLWTSDATPETISSLLGIHGECISLLSSEGGIFDIVGGRYSNGIPNLDIFLKGHSGDSDTTDRLSRETIHLRYPRITMGISCQPEVLNGLASIKGAEGKGLFARILFLNPQSKLGYRTLDAPPIPSAVRTAYEREITNMLDWPPNVNADIGCYQLSLSDDAMDEWQEYRHWVEREMRPDGSLVNYKSWAGKSAGAVLRIAAVLHGALYSSQKPWELPVSGDTMKSALEIMAVILQHSVSSLSTMGADISMSNARLVLDLIRRKTISTSTIRNIYLDLKHRLPTAKIVMDAVSLLEERGYVQIREQASTGGRPPSPLVIVRPEIVVGDL